MRSRPRLPHFLSVPSPTFCVRCFVCLFFLARACTSTVSVGRAGLLSGPINTATSFRFDGGSSLERRLRFFIQIFRSIEPKLIATRRYAWVIPVGGGGVNLMLDFLIKISIRNIFLPIVRFYFEKKRISGSRGSAATHFAMNAYWWSFEWTFFKIKNPILFCT